MLCVAIVIRLWLYEQIAMMVMLGGWVAKLIVDNIDGVEVVCEEI